MGKHFDSLVDVMKSGLPQEYHTEAKIGLDVNRYLDKLGSNSWALFDFPLRSEQILPHSKRDKQEYHDYLKNYFQMSKEFGTFLATPYDKTAIEDPYSVVFMDYHHGSTYTCTTIENSTTNGNGQDVTINIGTVRVEDIVPPPLMFYVSPIYSVRVNGTAVEIPVDRQPGLGALQHDLANSALAYIQETVYIEDPANFIVKKENNAFLKGRGRGRSKNGKKMRKTIMRPHFTILSEADLSSFLNGESKEPRVIHPVRGYWRTFSEKFRHVQGKTIRIKQYMRGSGKIEGKNGWHYQVMIKDDLVTVREFEENDRTKAAETVTV